MLLAKQAAKRLSIISGRRRRAPLTNPSCRAEWLWQSEGFTREDRLCFALHLP